MRFFSPLLGTFHVLEYKCGFNNVNLVVAIRGVCAIVGEESRVKWKEGHLLGGAGGRDTIILSLKSITKGVDR